MKHLHLPKRMLTWLGIDLDVNNDDEVYILEQKGKTLHLLLLAMVFVFSLVFTGINLYSKTGPASITIIPAPLTVVCFLLYRKGLITASKLLNFFQVSFVIAALTVIVSPSSGVLAFYIPTAVGAQIMFAGKDRRIAHWLCTFVVAALVLLIAIDYRLPGEPARIATDMTQEWIMNYVGATMAVLLEIIFILSVSNRIQSLLIAKKHLIELQNEELQRTNQELDRFVYAVSHDLRTPLVSLKGLLDLILRLPVSPEKALNYLQMAKTSTNRLDETIRDILEYARNARLEPVPEKFDLTKLVEQVFTDHSFAAKRPVKLLINGPVPACWIKHDKNRIHIILRNLIGNAVKYASGETEEPFVQVNLYLDEQTITIEVCDNGEGIPAECLPKIFDMFYRGTSTAEGTGLGLYICKQVVTKLKGEITVESELHSGTTVRVQLPLPTTQEE